MQPCRSSALRQPFRHVLPSSPTALAQSARSLPHDPRQAPSTVPSRQPAMQAFVGPALFLGVAERGRASSHARSQLGRRRVCAAIELAGQRRRAPGTQQSLFRAQHRRSAGGDASPASAVPRTGSATLRRRCGDIVPPFPSRRTDSTRHAYSNVRDLQRPSLSCVGICQGKEMHKSLSRSNQLKGKGKQAKKFNVRRAAQSKARVEPREDAVVLLARIGVREILDLAERRCRRRRAAAR